MRMPPVSGGGGGCQTGQEVLTERPFQIIQTRQVYCEIRRLTMPGLVLGLADGVEGLRNRQAGGEVCTAGIRGEGRDADRVLP